MEGRWHSAYGDRDQMLVLIGVGLDKERLQKALEDALLTDAEMAEGPEAWRSYEDPFRENFGGECGTMFWDPPSISTDERSKDKLKKGSLKDELRRAREAEADESSSDEEVWG